MPNQRFLSTPDRRGQVAAYLYRHTKYGSKELLPTTENEYKHASTS